MVQLQSPQGIELSGPGHELLVQVSAAIEHVNRFRPLDADVAEKLRDALLPDRIVASLNMEGVIATRRQTLAVMDAMRVNEVIGRAEEEIFNALKADEFVHDAVAEGIPLNEQFIREINRLLLAGIRDDAGAFRTESVELPGAPFSPPPPGDVPALVQELCQLFPLSESLHPTVQAAWLHAQFTLIHPFCDGNGRGGRLLQDWALVRRGLLPVGIPPSQRDDYYSALENSDKGRWDDIVELVGLLQLTMISRTEALLEDRQKRAAWIERLSEAAARKDENTRHKTYLVWRKRMERVAHAFGQAARDLDISSRVIGATFRDYGVVEFRDWELICRRGRIERSWLFSLLFFAEGQPFYKAIAYLKRHEPRSNVDPFPPPKSAVGLYFTGTEAPEGPRPDFHSYEDPHIRVRELLFLEDSNYVYRQPDPEADWEVGAFATTEEVVEELFTDLFSRKAGIGS